jgi:hypothetical protein
MTAILMDFDCFVGFFSVGHPLDEPAVTTGWKLKSTDYDDLLAITLRCGCGLKMEGCPKRALASPSTSAR